MHRNETMVRRFYQAFATGDAATMTDLTTDDVVFSVPGSNRLSGDHKGRDAMFALFGLVGELTVGKISVSPVAVTAVGNATVVSTHRLEAERDGKKLDIYETETITIDEDGKVTRFDESTSDQDASDAFWV